jgi:type VI secretion system protein ImpE
VSDARETLRSGDARAALEQLKQEVRRAPRDARLRVFLFQLFCIFGEWERAVTQLTVAAQLDPLTVPMAQAYRAAIRCEMMRTKVFQGTRSPTIFGQPEPWMSLLVEAVRVLATGQESEAAGLRDAAFEQAEAVAGSINGTAFEWIADADPRLGPMLEAMVDGKYYWVPFHRLRLLEIEAPADLRDQVWMPARFVWANGGETLGFLPTRYPGSQAAADQGLALASRTEWQEKGSWYLGLGQRMLATDGGEFALMDVRRLTFAQPDAPHVAEPHAAEPAATEAEASE